MEFLKQTIPGVYEIRPRVLTDSRGAFVKTFHGDKFMEAGLEMRFLEEYYSVSRRGVLRGLHFQTPPQDHAKLVYCVSGSVMDAVVDLRVGSPTLGEYAMFELGGDMANMVYVPNGLAHGFYVTSHSAIVVYKTTSVYARAHDAGIRWDSAGIPWPDSHPIISERDRGLVKLREFESPFEFGG